MARHQMFETEKIRHLYTCSGRPSEPGEHQPIVRPTNQRHKPDCPNIRTAPIHGSADCTVRVSASAIYCLPPQGLIVIYRVLMHNHNMSKPLLNFSFICRYTRITSYSLTGSPIKPSPKAYTQLSLVNTSISTSISHIFLNVIFRPLAFLCRSNSS